MCPEGRTCLYKISSKVNDHSSEPDDSDQKLESVLLDAEYEVQVSTIADTNDNARVLELRGQSNLMKHGHGTEEGTTEHREEFSQCAVNVIQDKNHGKILATIVPTSNKCPKWGASTLINTARTLVPVVAHSTSSKNTFSHKETVGADDRRVDTDITMVAAGQHRVESTIHHHFYSHHQKTPTAHFEPLVQAMTQKTQEITHAHGNSFTKCDLLLSYSMKLIYWFAGALSGAES